MKTKDDVKFDIDEFKPEDIFPITASKNLTTRFWFANKPKDVRWSNVYGKILSPTKFMVSVEVLTNCYDDELKDVGDFFFTPEGKFKAEIENNIYDEIYNMARQKQARLDQIRRVIETNVIIEQMVSKYETLLDK